jgi:uncharacterized protein YdhG (YjbR/CyaY superfamily)
MSTRSAPKTIDEYIAAFPPDVQAALEKIRLTIRAAVPKAEEKISYKIPAFTLDGDLIYCAAFTKHIGMYPPVQGDKKLSKELAGRCSSATRFHPCLPAYQRVRELVRNPSGHTLTRR